MREINVEIRTFTKIHRAIIGLAVVALLAYLTWYDTKTTLKFIFTPDEHGRLEKRNSSPIDSPVIEFGGRTLWFVNQPATPFTLELMDIFETLTISVYYSAPRPEQVALVSDRTRSLPLINTEKITLFEKLEDSGWPWRKQSSDLSAHLFFYEKPGLPDNFPAFGTFVEEGTVERVLQNVEVFMVKNDQNIEYRPITAEFKLPYIAYLLVPDLDTLQYANTLTKIGQDTYMVQLTEKLHEEVRERGAKYRFRIVLEGYEPGDWATVQKVEALCERKPVTWEGFQQFLRGVLAP